MYCNRTGAILAQDFPEKSTFLVSIILRRGKIIFVKFYKSRIIWYACHCHFSGSREHVILDNYVVCYVGGRYIAQVQRVVALLRLGKVFKTKNPFREIASGNPSLQFQDPGAKEPQKSTNGRARPMTRTGQPIVRIASKKKGLVRSYVTTKDWIALLL